MISSGAYKKIFASIYKYAIIPFSFGGQSTIATILDGTSQRLSTFELVNKFERLINNHKTDFAAIQKSLESSLRIAKYELEWYKGSSASIVQLLQAYNNAK